MGHPWARSGGVGGSHRNVSQCRVVLLPSHNCPHSAPTTPEMMIKIDRLSIERKKEFRGNTRDLC